MKKMCLLGGSKEDRETLSAEYEILDGSVEAQIKNADIIVGLKGVEEFWLGYVFAMSLHDKLILEKSLDETKFPRPTKKIQHILDLLAPKEDSRLVKLLLYALYEAISKHIGDPLEFDLSTQKIDDYSKYVGIKLFANEDGSYGLQYYPREVENEDVPVQKAKSERKTPSKGRR